MAGKTHLDFDNLMVREVRDVNNEPMNEAGSEMMGGWCGGVQLVQTKQLMGRLIYSQGGGWNFSMNKFQVFCVGNGANLV